ncbi:geranylgeranyl reductase [Chthoniobacter flavus Ellin428]|uniref:Geranylgeranyl reductase n=1 Tax=Chthoniobacter flavus Ellin428 TaxID=497964 RepID=B4CVZ2_9BACT|nr:NAD(P)/FAD-dependent oxidoreductase [Chthoniobacter flavus]EDY21584.1 geranylgeranyl reductase [Chthoniobacter flavus Ellin428]TCO95527.1 geranylgeranyl reductase family protein [Chthoniobacter flavus]
MEYDVAIIGAGPAGSTCAAHCAQAGWRTLVIEKARFPRDKVCGDCVNPACWPILDRLGVTDRLHAQPHSRLKEVAFVSPQGRTLRLPLPDSDRGEIAIPRRLFDAVLLDRARELGAEVHEDAPLTALESGWKLQTTRGSFSARYLIAADGRNSTVARLLGLLPAAAKDRIGLQAHLPIPSGMHERVAMHFLPFGYCGMNDIGNEQFNLCLVARPERLADLKAWAAARFDIAPETAWRTITPLSRAPIGTVHERLLAIGDAARIVEPFTGEGIYYALASGELAARHLLANDLPGFAAAHARLYRGRLWVNELARAAVLRPWLATGILEFAHLFPRALQFLTSKVVAPATSGEASASTA